MKKILIINLSDEGQIFEMSHLVSSYKEKNPFDQIELLCDKKVYEKSTLINNINKIHTLDLEKIKLMINNDLYADGFALNKLYQDIKCIYHTPWSTVINYDNSQMSKYLTSSLNFEEYIGTRIREDGSEISSNDWAIYQNTIDDEINTQNNINKLELMHQIAGLECTQSNNRINLTDDFEKIAEENFNTIKINEGQDLRFVGIFLSEKESIKKEIITDTIRSFDNTEKIKIVLIHEGGELQKKLIHELNNKFSNNLISIQTDKDSLPSVIKRMKSFISLENEKIKLAQALNIKTIYITNKRDLIDNYATQTKGDIVLYPHEKTLEFYDLFSALNTSLGLNTTLTQETSAQIFETKEKQGKIYLEQINGPTDHENIKRELRRHIDYLLLEKRDVQNKFSNLKPSFFKNYSKEMYKTQKEEITFILKMVLNTLRAKQSAINSKNEMLAFLDSLDQILSLKNTDSIYHTPVHKFYAKIEALEKKDTLSNLKTIEESIYLLKSEIQQINLFIDRIQAYKSTTKDRSFISL